MFGAELTDDEMGGMEMIENTQQLLEDIEPQVVRKAACKVTQQLLEAESLDPSGGPIKTMFGVSEGFDGSDTGVHDASPCCDALA